MVIVAFFSHSWRFHANPFAPSVASQLTPPFLGDGHEQMCRSSQVSLVDVMAHLSSPTGVLPLTVSFPGQANVLGFPSTSISFSPGEPLQLCPRGPPSCSLVCLELRLFFKTHGKCFQLASLQFFFSQWSPYSWSPPDVRTVTLPIVCASDPPPVPIWFLPS